MNLATKASDIELTFGNACRRTRDETHGDLGAEGPSDLSPGARARDNHPLCKSTGNGGASLIDLVVDGRPVDGS